MDLVVSERRIVKVRDDNLFLRDQPRNLNLTGTIGVFYYLMRDADGQNRVIIRQQFVDHADVGCRLPSHIAKKNGVGVDGQRLRKRFIPDVERRHVPPMDNEFRAALYETVQADADQ